MIFLIKKFKEKINQNYDYVVNLAGYVDHSHKYKTMKSHYNGCKNISSFFKIKNKKIYSSWIEYLNMEKLVLHKKKII